MDITDRISRSKLNLLSWISQRDRKTAVYVSLGSALSGDEICEIIGKSPGSLQPLCGIGGTAKITCGVSYDIAGNGPGPSFWRPWFKPGRYYRYVIVVWSDWFAGPDPSPLPIYRRRYQAQKVADDLEAAAMDYGTEHWDTVRLRETKGDKWLHQRYIRQPRHRD